MIWFQQDLLYEIYRWEANRLRQHCNINKVHMICNITWFWLVIYNKWSGILFEFNWIYLQSYSFRWGQCTCTRVCTIILSAVAATSTTFLSMVLTPMASPVPVISASMINTGKSLANFGWRPSSSSTKPSKKSSVSH